MPEDTATPEHDAPPEGADAGQDAPQGTDPADTAGDVDKWRALARKHEERAKENAAKAKQFDELVESQKSETQKLVDAKSAAEQQLADTAAELARAKAAIKHGLTEEDLQELEGIPAEHVERIAARISAASKKPEFPDLAQGRGKPGATKPNQNDLLRAAARR